MAYNVGFGDKKRTVWVSAIYSGKKALGAVPYLTKGKQVTVSLNDVEPNLYNENVSLKGYVVDLEFVGNKDESKPATQAKQAQQPVDDGSGLEDDIPFQDYT